MHTQNYGNDPSASCMTSQIRWEMKNLIPVVTATCPRRLNQPQIHEAKGAFLGVESIAAQKYGPPLVGWALQTSKRYQQSGGAGGVLDYRPAMAKPTIMVKTAQIEPSCEHEMIVFSPTRDYHETPNHNHWTSGVLRVYFSEF